MQQCEHSSPFPLSPLALSVPAHRWRLDRHIRGMSTIMSVNKFLDKWVTENGVNENQDKWKRWREDITEGWKMRNGDIRMEVLEKYTVLSQSSVTLTHCAVSDSVCMNLVPIKRSCLTLSISQSFCLIWLFLAPVPLMQSLFHTLRRHDLLHVTCCTICSNRHTHRDAHTHTRTNTHTHT